MIRVRASSLAELFDCPARWEAKHIQGKYLPRSGAAQLGTAIHAAAAAFDASSINDAHPITENDAAAVLVDSIHNQAETVAWEETKPADAEKIGLALHTKYCQQIAPKQNYIGVEVYCKSLEIPELGIALTGTTDRIRETETGAGIADIKTGATAVSADGTVKTQGHAAQLGVYELLAESAFGLSMTAPAQIVAMNTAKTEKSQRVATAEIASPRDALLGTEESPGLLEHASHILKNGFFLATARAFYAAKSTARFSNNANLNKGG